MSDKATNEIRKELIWVILLRVFFEATTIFGVYLLFIAANYFFTNIGNVFKSFQKLGQLWFFISVTIAIIRIGLDSARYIQRKPLIFPLLPLMPLLVQTVEALLIELLISAIIILPLLNFNVLSVNQIFFFVAIIIAFFELARRTSRISTVLYRTTFRIISSTQKAAGEIKNSWLPIVYWLLTIAFLVIASKLLIQGLAIPFDNEPDTARELFSNVLTLVTAILAIFFTGATLIIQLIVGVYSFRFTTVISRNPIVIGSFAIIILIGLGHLVLLRVGWNSYLASLSLYSSIYTILVLAVLVILFIEYIQVPNVVKIVSREIQRYIKGSPKQKNLLNSTLIKTGKVSLVYRIKSFLLGYLLGDQQSPYLAELSSYNLPKEINKEITEKVRPLFSACLKAVNDDRREIALVCLSEINEIHKSYIIKFKDTLYGGDEFLMFMLRACKRITPHFKKTNLVMCVV